MGIRNLLNKNSEEITRSMERVASGRRINRAGDDAAGMALASLSEGKIRSAQQAERNALDALSSAQVAEGGMNEIDNLLIRMRELAIQGASDTLGGNERGALGIEMKELISEVDRISHATKYFGTTLLDGQGSEFTYQIGVENDAPSRITYDGGMVDLRASSLGISGINVEDSGSARDALGAIDSAISKVSIPRAQLGAIQTRLNSVIHTMGSYTENMSAALSRIRDADLASETSNVVRNQIQVKAAAAVLSQANTLPLMALDLVKGIT
ncbi:MAG: flagellin FliC [Deltaproteobacteria bacterium]|nr:flagellin FliC [Deltaproteobacteria bacterium]MBI3295511.1 flagellin FliC [Deltaproteobacteria bacterium]